MSRGKDGEMVKREDVALVKRGRLVGALGYSMGGHWL